MRRESKSDPTRQRGPFNQRNRFQASVSFLGGGTQCADAVLRYVRASVYQEIKFS